MAHNGDLAAHAVIGFGFGLYTFYKGFRQYRNFLLIADTPEIAIRSIPMGFAQVNGIAKGAKTLPSPISHTPCFAYAVKGQISITAIFTRQAHESFCVLAGLVV